MNDVLSWILTTVQSVDPLLRTLIAMVGMFCETSLFLGVIAPGDTIVLVASSGVVGPLQYFALVAAVIVGSLGGESVGFALGRYFGPRIRHSRLGRRIGEKNWDRAENYLARRGGIAVFISRFLPVLHSVVPVTVGTSPMRYRTFMAWTVPACVLWAFAYVSVGTFAGGSFRQLSGQLSFAGFIFVGIVVVFAVLALVGKKLLERREARHMSVADVETPNEAREP